MAMSVEQKEAKAVADRAAIKTRDLPNRTRDFSYLLAVALVGAPTESASKNPEALTVAPVGATALVPVKTEVVIHAYCGAADLVSVKYYIGRIYTSKLSGVKHIAPEAVIVPPALTASATSRRASAGATSKINTPTVYRDFEAAAKAVTTAPTMLAYVTYARQHKAVVDWSLAEYDQQTGADPTVAGMLKRYGTLAPTGAAAVALAHDIEVARAAVALVNDAARRPVIIYSKTRAIWHRVLAAMSEASIQVCSTMPQTEYRAARQAALAAAPDSHKIAGLVAGARASVDAPTAPTASSKTSKTSKTSAPTSASADRRARNLTSDNSEVAKAARKAAAAARDQRASDAAAAAVAPAAPTSASKTASKTAAAPVLTDATGHTFPTAPTSAPTASKTSDQTAPTSAAA